MLLFRILGVVGRLISVTVLTSVVIGSAALAQNVQKQRVEIFTNDPRDVILEVYVNSGFRPILSRSGNGVEVEVSGDPDQGGEIVCNTTVDIVLANRTRRRQDVDICSANFNITINKPATSAPLPDDVERASLTEREQQPVNTAPQTPSAEPVLIPAQEDSTESGPSEEHVAQPLSSDDASRLSTNTADGTTLPPIQQSTNIDTGETQQQASVDPSIVAVPQESETSETVPPVDPLLQQSVVPAREGLTWSVDSNAEIASLRHAVGRSDDRDFFASCGLGSRQTEVFLYQTPLDMQNGQSVEVTLSAGTYRATYTGTAVFEETAGVAYPKLTIPTSDPLYPALIREREVVSKVTGGQAITISLRGSAGPVRSFLSSCNLATVGPTSDGPNADQSTGLAVLGCSSRGTARSRRADNPATMRFTNTTNGVIQLFWLDYQGQQQFYVALQPGDRYDQPSFYSHPWLVTSVDGRCLGIYQASQAFTEITVGVGGQQGVYSNRSQSGGSFATGPLAPPAPAAPPAPPAPAAPGGPQFGGNASFFQYQCDNGSALTVAFNRGNNTATVTSTDGTAVTLFPFRTNRGFRFIYQQYELRGDGPVVTWSDGGRLFTRCFER